MTGNRPGGDTNCETPRALTYVDPLKTEYQKLLELRERVRRAELAAKRTRHSLTKVRHDPRGPDTDSAG
jgi:hypothetical protein